MTAKKAIELLKDFKAMTGQAVGEDIIEPIEQALIELEKKDKLLKLYRLSQKWIFAVSAEWKELDKQIKELEEELKK